MAHSYIRSVSLLFVCVCKSNCKLFFISLIFSLFVFEHDVLLPTSFSEANRMLQKFNSFIHSFIHLTYCIEAMNKPTKMRKLCVAIDIYAKDKFISKEPIRKTIQQSVTIDINRYKSINSNQSTN